MNNKEIVCFERAAELESISQAAHDLNISQGQLSRIVAKLEQEFDAALIEREGRGIRLTEAGKALYRYFIGVMSDYYEAIIALREASMHNVFQVTIAANLGVYMPKLLAYIAKEHHEIRYRDVLAPRSTLEIMLKDLRADFAISMPALSGSDLETEILINEKPAVIYGDGHWLEGRSVVSLLEIKGENFISSSEGYASRDAMESYYHEMGVSPKYVMETENAYAVEKYVRRGLGIAIMAKSLVLQSDFAKTHYVDVAEDVWRTVGISWLKNKTLTDAERNFLESARTYFTKTVAPLIAYEPEPPSDPGPEGNCTS